MLKIIKQKVNDKLELNVNAIHTFLNPYSYLLARKQQNIFSDFDYIHIDGIALVIFLKLIGIKTIRRSFDMTSIAPLLFEYCQEQKKSIYFIGAKLEELEKSIKVFQNSYPHMNIKGFHHGYIEKQWNEKIEEIIQLNPDFVIVGMGTPIQEKFLIDLRKKGFKGSGFTCGGFLHQSQQDIDYYPPIFDKLNIRWIYRMIDEPKLVKRYFIDYPVFVGYFMIDALKFVFKK